MRGGVYIRERHRRELSVYFFIIVCRGVMLLEGARERGGCGKKVLDAGNYWAAFLLHRFELYSAAVVVVVV